MVLIPTLIFIKMAKEKRLLVTAIAQQIDDAGKAEMTEAFTVEEQIVEE